MKKIPTLFKREFNENGHGVKSISPALASPEFLCVLKGETIPTVKMDGSCCAVVEDLTDDCGFIELKEWLRTHEEEGIVFWRNHRPICKIKRTDFGFEWPIKK